MTRREERGVERVLEIELGRGALLDPLGHPLGEVVHTEELSHEQRARERAERDPFGPGMEAAR